MEQNFNTTPPEHPPIPPAEAPLQPEVKSYTASAFDRFQAGNTGGAAPVPPPPEEKPKKTVSLATSVITSVIVAVISSVLVFMVMMYGMDLGNLLQTESPADTGSQSDTVTENKTTNIVVDTSAQTSAEAVAEKAGPSVVGVVVTSSYYNIMDTSSEGSGIIYSDDGYIITNYHVIQTAVESTGTVAVYLPSDSATGIDATVVGYDISSDIAVLKIDKEGLPAIELADSDALKVGQTAIAIGNPGGMDFMGSVSMGIISGLDRTLQLENSSTEINLIQTDASINPGNSGGALVNAAGQLIGINSAKMASENFEGMGFAIPSNDAKTIIERIIKNQDAPQPYIGIIINTQYDSSTLQRMGLPAGVVVDSVAADSPAAEAGLQAYDIITQFNGVAVNGYTQFNSEKAKYQPGDTVTLTVYRSTRTYTVELKLGIANQ